MRAVLQGIGDRIKSCRLHDLQCHGYLRDVICCLYICHACEIREHEAQNPQHAMAFEEQHAHARVDGKGGMPDRCVSLLVG